MSKSNSKKVIAAVIAVALVASIIGVIPPSANMKAEASSTNWNISQIKVGDILYSGDVLTGGNDDIGVTFINKYLDGFTGNNYDKYHQVSRNYIISNSSVPNAPMNYDSWRVVGKAVAQSTDAKYGDLNVYCEPYKSTTIVKQPQNVTVPNGNNAIFEVQTSNAAKDNYSWCEKSNSVLPINYTIKDNESTKQTGSAIIPKKAIMEIQTAGSSTKMRTLFSLYKDGYKYNNEELISTGNSTIILEPGTYTYSIDCYRGEIGDYFSLLNFNLTTLSDTKIQNNPITINKYSPLYKSGNKLVCLINNSLITNEAQLTIGEAAFEKIHTPKKTLYLTKKQSVTLPVYAYKTDGTKEKLTFTSSKKKIATVGKKNGKVKAKKTGTTTITAKTNSGKKYKIKVKVTKKKSKLKKLTISGAPKTMDVGSRNYLSLKSKPAKATKVVAKWSSSNSSVISVSKNGRIEAKKVGTAKITAKIGKKKATKTITVY